MQCRCCNCQKSLHLQHFSATKYQINRIPDHYVAAGLDWWRVIVVWYFLTLKILWIHWGSSDYLQTVESSWRAISNGGIIRYVYSHEQTLRNQLALDLVLSVSSNKYWIKLRHNSWTKNFSFSHWFEFYCHWPETPEFFVQAHKRWTKTKFKDEKNQVTSYQQSIMGTLQQTMFSVTISTLWMSNFHIDTRIRNLCSLKPDIPWQGWEVHWTAFKKDPGFTNDWFTRVRSSRDKEFSISEHLMPSIKFLNDE